MVFVITSWSIEGPASLKGLKKDLEKSLESQEASFTGGFEIFYVKDVEWARNRLT